MPIVTGGKVKPGSWVCGHYGHSGGRGQSGNSCSAAAPHWRPVASRARHTGAAPAGAAHGAARPS